MGIAVRSELALPPLHVPVAFPCSLKTRAVPAQQRLCAAHWLGLRAAKSFTWPLLLRSRSTDREPQRTESDELE
ncbi:hypothetical protein GUITHDRAFT_150028 [Guillardia theta CCMP2712]|uniref:Uncharacterized protein n=1 Tax=Guillardia theta (strain CCMP2712) TaxID=905079 RepID=L1K1K5_GUITC|nr:hypothetical protein GUITHDRAFT_150028 [Guillardia theta CCMP2712]EKX54492.1 hypothetical protein GUITHDRAFT_150028 [Guillardia theta CCMP2712]|eukprot:XP_005841472.1 hypothetical protein GUITHDRAFT_150028 [Guillardia theta CCMP2712]